MNEREILQSRLYVSIEMYGSLDERTVKLSQQLDLIVVAEQKELNRFRC